MNESGKVRILGQNLKRGIVKVRRNPLPWQFIHFTCCFNSKDLKADLTAELSVIYGAVKWAEKLSFKLYVKNPNSLRYRHYQPSTCQLFQQHFLWSHVGRLHFFSNHGN